MGNEKGIKIALLDIFTTSVIIVTLRGQYK